MNYLLTLFGFVILSAVAGQCESPIHHSAKVKIGALLPLSGQYAAVGVDSRQGIEVALSEAGGGSSLEFIFADSKADPTTAVSEFRKVLDVDGVVGIYAFRGPVGMAVNPLSKRARVSLLGGVGNKHFALDNEYAFQLWPRSDVEGQYLADYWSKLGYKKVALLTVQDDWPVAVSTGLRERGKGLGFDFVLDQEILPTETDFRTHIVQLRKSNPDVVFLNVGLNQIAALLRQLNEMDIKTEIFSNFWLGKKEVLTAAGSAGHGVRFVEMTTQFPKLKQALKDRFDSTPSGATLSAYVATHMLLQALEGGEVLSTESLHQRLSAMSEVRTDNGVFQVKNRFVDFPLSIRVVRNGNVEEDLGKN